MKSERVFAEKSESVPSMSIGEALVAIEALRAAIMARGANDAEGYILDNVVRRLISGEMTPAESVNSIHSLSDSKYDYH